MPVEAEYLFPLNRTAAVNGLEMRGGGEVITAVIQEKEQAEATFQTAADEGRAAALLTQHRPNMFTQRIANLMPVLTVEVTLRYVQMVPRIDGQQELIIPLVVGPRYQGAPEGETVNAASDDAAPLPANTWTIDNAPEHPPLLARTFLTHSAQSVCRLI